MLSQDPKLLYNRKNGNKEVNYKQNTICDKFTKNPFKFFTNNEEAKYEIETLEKINNENRGHQKSKLNSTSPSSRKIGNSKEKIKNLKILNNLLTELNINQQDRNLNMSEFSESQSN